MLFLSDEAIEYAVKMCCANSHYEVLIVGKALTTVQQIFERLISISQKITEANRSFRAGHTPTVIFDNNSCITVVSATPCNARGRKVHLLIADKNINYNLLHREFTLCEVLEDWDMRNKQVESVSDDPFEKIINSLRKGEQPQNVTINRGLLPYNKFERNNR